MAFSDCTKIADNNLRLACFDRLADAVSQPPAEQPAGVLPAMPPPATTAVAEARKNRPGFSLSDHWELDEAHKRGIFKFRPHGANYEPAYQQGCSPARLGVADCRAAKGLYARIYRIWAEPDRL